MIAYQQRQIDIRVGKKGITPGLIKEMKMYIQRKGWVKIRMLQSHAEGQTKQDLAKELASASGTKLLWRVGGVLVLGKALVKE